jgi:hypothetical protein
MPSEDCKTKTAKQSLDVTCIHSTYRHCELDRILFSKVVWSSCRMISVQIAVVRTWTARALHFFSNNHKRWRQGSSSDRSRYAFIPSSKKPLTLRRRTRSYWQLPNFWYPICLTNSDASPRKIIWVRNIPTNSYYCYTTLFQMNTVLVSILNWRNGQRIRSAKE